MPTVRSEEAPGLFESVLLKPFFLAAMIIGFTALTVAADSGPQPGLKPLDEHGHLRISDQDRCPVCAMKVKAHNKFSCRSC